MNEVGLLPCPFCGGSAKIIEADEAGPSAYAVQCQTRGCEASSRVAFALGDDVADILADAWNRRAAPAIVSGATEGNEAGAAAPKPDVPPAELMERLEEIFVEDAPNKFVWKTQETQDEWIREKLLPALRDCRIALSVSNDRVAELERERDEARQIVRDIFWMALRYADGRMTYAVDVVNAAVRKGYDGGWITPKDTGGDPVTPRFARDGMLPEWTEPVARAEAAEAEVSRLKAGAVTGWQPIESVPKDGRSIAVWLPATATEQPHALAPVSICEDGTWWDDSTGDQIEPLAATYWAPIHAPSALPNQAGASK